MQAICLGSPKQTDRPPAVLVSLKTSNGHSQYRCTTRREGKILLNQNRRMRRLMEDVREKRHQECYLHVSAASSYACIISLYTYIYRTEGHEFRSREYQQACSYLRTPAEHHRQQPAKTAKERRDEAHRPPPLYPCTARREATGLAARKLLKGAASFVNEGQEEELSKEPLRAENIEGHSRLFGYYKEEDTMRAFFLPLISFLLRRCR